MRINYFFERNSVTYVNLSVNGRNYDRRCKLDGLNRPTFRLFGKIYKPDCNLQWYPEAV